jgi:hypothetical protein
MVERIYFFYLVVMIIFFSSMYRSGVNSALTENGTCMDGNVPLGNKTHSPNQTYAKFIKNLTSDNRPLAEIVCQALLNQSVSK